MFTPQCPSKYTNEHYIPQTPRMLFTDLSIKKLISSQNVYLPLVSKYPQKFMNSQRMRSPIVLLQCYKPDSESFVKLNELRADYSVKENDSEKMNNSTNQSAVIPNISVPSVPNIVTNNYKNDNHIIENETENNRSISPTSKKIKKMKTREFSPQTKQIEDKIINNIESKKAKKESEIKTFLDNIVSVSSYKSSKQINNTLNSNNKTVKKEKEKDFSDMKVKESTVNANNKTKKEPIKMSQFKRKKMNNQSKSTAPSPKKSKIETTPKKRINYNDKDLSSQSSLYDNYKQVNNTLNNSETKQMFSEIYELISSPSLEIDSSVLIKTNFLSNDSKSISTIKEITKNNENVENYDKELKLLTDIDVVLDSLKNDKHNSDTYIFSLYQQLTQYSIVEIRKSNDKSSELYKEIKEMNDFINGVITFDMTLFSTTFYKNVDDLKENIMQLLEYISDSNNNHKTISYRTLILIFTVIISKLSSIYYVIPLICHELLAITYDVYVDLFKTISFNVKQLSNEERLNIAV